MVPGYFPKEGLDFRGDEREPDRFMWKRVPEGGEERTEKKEEMEKRKLEEGVQR